MRSHIRTLALAVAASAALSMIAAAQAPAPLDPAPIGRIRDEATTRSQAYEHVWRLSEVYGPRVTGTPAFAQASEWAMKKFREWGLANVHQERWAFGQGWSIQRFSVTMLEPQPAVLIGAPRNFSPSTTGVVASEVVRVAIGGDADFAKYAGTLRGKIVVMQPVRAVRMLEGPVILRMDEGPWWNEAATPVEPAPAAPPSPAAAAATQERLEYNSRSHHSNMDTFDRVQKDEVTQQGAVVAVFAWSAANWPEKLPRKTVVK